MKRSLRYGLIAVAGLSAAAAVLPPLLIDEAAVQHRLERAAYEATGRELAIGDIGFSLLPTPRLHAEGLRLANWPDSAEPWMLDVKRMTITVSAGDLLRGRLVAKTVELDSPRLTLERRAGRGNWSFVPPGQMPPRPDAAAAPAAAAPAAAAAQAEDGPPVSVERLLVRDGRIAYRDGAAGRTLAATAIALEAQAQSPQGPFRAEGGATVSGHAVTFKGDSGRVQPGRAVPLHIEATAENGRVKLDGLLLRDTDAGPVLKGNLDAAVADVAAFAARFGAGLPGRFAGRALSLSGQVRLAAEGGEVTESQVRLGPTEAAGRIGWHLDGSRPRLSVDLASRHLDLDAFAAPARAARGEDFGGVALLAPAIAHAAAAAPAFTFSLPTGLDADVKLAADAVTWHGDAARTALLDFSLNRGDVVVNQAAAELPGAAQVRAIGFIGGDLKRLDLTLQAGAANLRSLLSWIGADASAVPADRLRRAGFSARAAISGDGLIQLRDIDAVLDATHAKGALDLRWGARPAFGLSLAVDRFDIDAYRGAAPGPTAAAPPRILPAAAPADAAPADEPPLWDRFDANLDLQVGRLVAGGQPLDRLRLQGRWQDSTLDIAGLSAEIGGEGRITASGKVSTHGAARVEALKAEVTTPRADRLLGLMPVSWPGFVRTWRALTATLSADGPLTDLRTDAAVGVGEVKLTVAARFDAVRMRPSAEGDIAVSAPTLGALAAVLDADVAPEMAKKGTVEIYIPLNGDAHGYAVPALTATAGDIAIGGELTVKTDGPRPQVSARLIGNLLPVFVPRNGAPPRRSSALPPRIVPAAAPAAPAAPSAPQQPANAAAAPPPAWTVLRDIDGDLAASFDSVVAPKLTARAVKLTARLDQGLLTLDEATAELLGGRLSASGRADLTAIPRLVATVDAENIAVDAKSPLFSGNAPLAGTVTLAAAGEAAGGDADTLLRGLNGKGKLSVLNGSFAGVDLGAVNDRLAKIKTLQDLISAFEAGGRGRTAFDSLAGNFTVAGGVLESRDLKLSAPSGEGSASGTADLAARKVNAEVRFALAGLKDAPPLGLRLQGAWENPRVFFDTGDFQGYMIQKGLKNLLRSLSKQKSSADEPPPPKGKLKPKDVLREVLQAIPQK
ncbi:AsmA family protein [Oleispirillum naphthae]|uniref:AsmA family protein n=1 Tax=Oleispirillum naphthae TaxID=2838853 RepID=UPI0030825C44